MDETPKPDLSVGDEGLSGVGSPSNEDLLLQRYERMKRAEVIDYENFKGYMIWMNEQKLVEAEGTLSHAEEIIIRFAVEIQNIKIELSRVGKSEAEVTTLKAGMEKTTQFLRFWVSEHADAQRDISNLREKLEKMRKFVKEYEGTALKGGASHSMNQSSV